MDCREHSTHDRLCKRCAHGRASLLLRIQKLVQRKDGPNTKRDDDGRILKHSKQVFVS